MSYLPGLGQITLPEVFQRYPTLGRAVLAYAHATVAMNGGLTAAECELIGAFVSRLNACGYCQRIHEEAAVVCGIDAGVFEGASGPGGPPYGDARWAPVYEFVRAVVVAPGSVSREHVGALSEAGWPDEAIVQIVAVVGLFSLLNRFADALGITADQAFLQQAGRDVASLGYAGVAEALGIAG